VGYLWFAAALAFVSLANEVSRLSLGAPAASAAGLAPAGESSDFFLQKVHPLLEAKCFGCHGEPKDREGEFDMRTREGLLKGGESGRPALIPGEPEKSTLFQAVLRQGKLKMPPKDRNKLSVDEIEVLRNWIASGEPWA